jgi:hypothetical protein
MKMAAIAEAFGIGIGIAIAIGSRLFRIRIANPDPDSDTDCYGLSLFSEQKNNKAKPHAVILLQLERARCRNAISLNIFQRWFDGIVLCFLLLHCFLSGAKGGTVTIIFQMI